MAHALYILRDDDFDAPIYADPPVDELDDEVWDAIVHVVHEAVEHNGSRAGTTEVAEQWVAWKMIPRSGVTFVIVMEDDYDQTDIQEYLQELSNHYVGEVEDVRFPDADGLGDVIIDIIAPWDE